MNTTIWKTARRFPWKMMLLSLTLVIGIAGCRNGKLGRVHGVVTHRGQTVTGGTLIFSPKGSSKEPGQPAFAEIQSDGSFTVATHGSADGALIGQHRVTYTPPSQELTEEQRSDPKYIAPRPPYMGMRPSQQEVEVKPGNNDLTIELVPAKS